MKPGRPNLGRRRQARSSPMAAGVLLAALALGSPSVQAEGGLRLSGFGTLGYAWDNRADANPARDISQAPSLDFATGGRWQLDSRLGVQLEYGPAADLDLVGQLVWRDYFKADLDSSVELAYAAFRPQPEIDVRAGRINYDAFLMSDHRNVGYAYPWVRPPAEFYGWIPIFSVDGVDAAYHLNTDDARWRVKVQAGRSKMSIPVGGGGDGGYNFRTGNLKSLSLTRQAAAWRLKAAHSQFTVGSEVAAFGALHQGLDQVAAAGLPGLSGEAADLRRNLGFKGARISYTTLGAAFDDGTWLAQAELGYTTATAAVVPHGRMGYASLGRRFGDWTPYVVRSVSRPGNAVRHPANDWGGLNIPLRDAALRILNTTRIEQATWTVGARWDFRQQAALKLQWERTRIKPSGFGLWWRDPAINNRTTRVDQLSVTLDFTF